MKTKTIILTIVFLVVSLFFSTVAIADDWKPQCVQANQCPARKPVHKSVQKVVQPERIVIVNNNTNTNNNAPVEKVKVVERKVLVERTVYRDRDEHKNAISVLFGRSSTGLQTTQTGPTTVDAKTVGQFDAGLMYQRDISRIRLSIGGTINGSVYGGVGLNF
jgi:hypothetical protein